MEKFTKNFEDGIITKYTFNNNNSITIIVMKKSKYNKKYLGCIGWNFGKYKLELIGNTCVPYAEYDTYNQARLLESLILYNSIKKHKSKSNDKKLLLSALQIVIHDIKEDIYINQKLF